MTHAKVVWTQFYLMGHMRSVEGKVTHVITIPLAVDRENTEGSQSLRPRASRNEWQVMYAQVTWWLGILVGPSFASRLPPTCTESSQVILE